MKGKSDGDFARALRVIKIHKLLYVSVPIMNIKICAYANRSVNKPIKQAYVVYQRGILVLDTMKFQRSELLNSSSQVLEFYNKRKQVDYFLGANMFFGDLLSKQKFKDFKCKIILFEIPVYHVVAEKNKHLIPELTESFKSYFPYNGDLRNSKSEKAR